MSKRESSGSLLLFADIERVEDLALAHIGDDFLTGT